MSSFFCISCIFVLFLFVLVCPFGNVLRVFVTFPRNQFVFLSCEELWRNDITLDVAADMRKSKRTALTWLAASLTVVPSTFLLVNGCESVSSCLSC